MIRVYRKSWNQKECFPASLVLSQDAILPREDHSHPATAIHIPRRSTVALARRLLVPRPDPNLLVFSLLGSGRVDSDRFALLTVLLRFTTTLYA